MTEIEELVDRAITKFLRGEDPAPQLDMANAEHAKVTEWAYKYDDLLSSFFLAVDEREIFLVDQEIELYFDPAYLCSLDESGIVSFFKSRLDDCVDECSAFHFIELRGVLVTVQSTPAGQGGNHFFGIQMHNTLDEFKSDVFASNYFSTDKEISDATKQRVLISYRKYVLDRMPRWMASAAQMPFRTNLLRNSKVDEHDDEVGRLCRLIQKDINWNNEKTIAKNQLCELVKRHRYHIFVGDPRMYGIGRIGGSVILSVATNQRGHLKQFRGEKIRLVCIGTGRYRRTYAVKDIST